MKEISFSMTLKVKLTILNVLLLQGFISCYENLCLRKDTYIFGAGSCVSKECPPCRIKGSVQNGGYSSPAILCFPYSEGTLKCPIFPGMVECGPSDIPDAPDTVSPETSAEPTPIPSPSGSPEAPTPQPSATPQLTPQDVPSPSTEAPETPGNTDTPIPGTGPSTPLPTSSSSPSPSDNDPYSPPSDPTDPIDTNITFPTPLPSDGTNSGSGSGSSNGGNPNNPTELIVALSSVGGVLMIAAITGFFLYYRNNRTEYGYPFTRGRREKKGNAVMAFNGIQNSEESDSPASSQAHGEAWETSQRNITRRMSKERTKRWLSNDGERYSPNLSHIIKKEDSFFKDLDTGGDESDDSFSSQFGQDSRKTSDVSYRKSIKNPPDIGWLREIISREKRIHLPSSEGLSPVNDREGKKHRYSCAYSDISEPSSPNTSSVIPSDGLGDN